MNGSIYGRVVDDLGAVLPGVTVRVCHLRTVVCNLTTDDCGCYQSPGLKPGWYDIVFWLSSEIPTWRSELAVLPGRRVEVEDFTLMPNGATERVTVFTRPTETCPRCLGERKGEGHGTP